MPNAPTAIRTEENKGVDSLLQQQIRHLRVTTLSQRWMIASQIALQFRQSSSLRRSNDDT
eukprot:2639338-Amphidinium_carterae.1